MAGNRKGATDWILTFIDEMAGPENRTLWANRLAEMNDKQFDAFVVSIETGEEMFCVIEPNLAPKEYVTFANNLKLAKKHGLEMFQRIWVDPGDGSPIYLTPERYLVTDQVFRRQAQLLVKKISIPDDNRSINDLTGQPSASGNSRSSKISYPESQIAAAAGLDNTLIEMLKYRGGDVKGFQAMNQMISQTGGASLETLNKLGTRVKSTDTLKTFLTCMHYEVDL